jgi:hypothetical protein
LLQLRAVHVAAPQKINDCPQRTCHAHSVHFLNIARFEMGTVKDQDFGYHAVTPKIFRHGHMQYRRHHV